MRKSEAKINVGYLENEYCMTQDECAERLKMSRRQVQRIEARALRKLAAAAKRSKFIREELNLDNRY